MRKPSHRNDEAAFFFEKYDRYFDMTKNNFNLELRLLEISIYSGKGNFSVGELNRLLKLTYQCMGNGEYAYHFNSSDNKILIDRIASCLTLFMLSSKFNLQENDFLDLINKRYIFCELFKASSFGGTTHIKNLLDNKDLWKCFLLSSLDDISVELIDFICNGYNVTESLMALSLLDEPSVLTDQGEKNREALLLNFDQHNILPFEQKYSSLVANAWMLCSYAACEEKHKIKIYLNQWFEKMTKGLNSKVKKKIKNKKKKVMVVVIEVMYSDHAMYRWYSTILKKLSNHYRLILVSHKDSVDSKVISIFHEKYIFNDEYKALPILLENIHPDIVYYPSLGMRSWSILLANIRWAPVQVMSLGHPATSNTKTIDGIFIEEQLFTSRKLFSEFPVIMKDFGHISAQGTISFNQPKKENRKDNYIVIAIPCISYKINSIFLEILQKINSLSAIPIIWNFYPNLQGISYLSFSKKIKDILPNSEVAPKKNYQEYLNNLAHADLALSSFPFGNATSLLDCILLGIPACTMVGQEPHSRTDFSLLNTWGLDNELCSSTLDQYVLNILSFIENNEKRNMISQKFKEISRFYTAKKEENIKFNLGSDVVSHMLNIEKLLKEGK